ncbi:MAG: ParB/RepB/Spo0J family partition protein [Terriglobales bacterium]
MAGTSNTAAADKTATKTVAEKVHEKVADKRKALGRGLDSLLPGPRAVPAAGTAPAFTQPFAPPASSAVYSMPVSAPAAIPAHSAAPRAVGPSVIPPDAQDQVRAESERGRDRHIAGHVADNDDAHQREDLKLQAAKENRTHEYEPAVPASGPETPTPQSVTVPQSTSDGEEVVQLATDLIDKNPHQTRRRFNETALEELSQSIKVQGLLQPIVVRPDGKGRFKLILGERRLRATGMAGHATVPAIMKRVNEQQAAEMTLVENLQRQDLNCVEQADAFARLSREFNMTQTEIGARVGMSRETVANYMRLLTLPLGVLEALVEGKLTFSHARVLLPLRDHVKIWSLAQRAIEERMTVQKLEDLVLGVPAKPETPSPQGGARWVDPNVKAAQRSLEEILGMRVRIRDRAGRGRILIDYATIDDFERIVGMLGGK